MSVWSAAGKRTFRIRSDQQAVVATTERESDLDYLRAIEALAQNVVDQAAAEDWLAFGDEGEKATVPLHRAINQLATRLRIMHFDGDGCLECLDADDPETN